MIGLTPHGVIRRGRFLALVVVLLVAVALGLGRFWWLPSWRPHLRAGERYAIDVSAHQGAIDWRRVRQDGIGLAYVKATEGRNFVDPRFRANVDSARDALVSTGVYHFFTLCTPGLEQAAHFRQTVGNPGPLPPAVDLELAGNCSARPDSKAVARELSAFLTEVERWADRPAVLYVGDDWEARYGLPKDAPRPIWVRHLLFRPGVDRDREQVSPGGNWSIWQSSSFASVDGIGRRVDLDVVQPGVTSR